MKGEVNYTVDMVKAMIEAYRSADEVAPKPNTIRVIAEQFGKTEKSVIAKLAREGVYMKAPRLNKAGQPAVRKEALVKVISQMVGYNLESLEKASKQDLIRVANALANAKAEKEAVAQAANE